MVYATDGYSASVSNMSQVTLEDDNLFGDDDAATELGTVTGSVSEGYVAKLTFAIDPDGTDAQASGGGEGGGGGTPPSGGPGGGGTPPSGAPQPTASASSGKPNPNN